MEDLGLNDELLIATVKMKMPFGKHKDKIICDLPMDYLNWFHRKGFPKGKLGQIMATAFEIKLNGLDFIFHKFKAMENKKEDEKKKMPRNILEDLDL